MAGKAFQWAWRGKLCSGHRLIISFTGIPTADPGHGIGRFALATLECALSGDRGGTRPSFTLLICQLRAVTGRSQTWRDLAPWTK